MNNTKRTSISAILAACLLLCSCGTMREDTGADISEAEASYQMISNDWLDTSDLTYAGTVEQRIAIGYDFDDPEDQNPIVIYDKYVSPDGETFHFDAQGRLRLYRNCDDVFYQNSSDALTQKASLTEDEKCSVMEKIYADAVDDVNACTVEEIAPGSYQLRSTGEQGVPATAQIDMTGSGEIRSITIGHHALEDPVDYAYFEAKVQEKIDDVKARHDVVECETVVRFEQTDDKIYALYTVTYSCAMDDTDETYNICEGYGFAKAVGQGGHEVS